MGIWQLGSHHFTTNEMRELVKQDEELEKNYCTQYKVTEEDIVEGKYNTKQIGNVIYKDPIDPPSKAECLKLFIDFYTKRKLIELKFYFLSRHDNVMKNWNVIDIEDRLNVYSQFINKASIKDVNLNQFQREEYEAFLFFQRGLHNVNYFEPSNICYIKVYATYFLFYDILKQKINELYRNGNFYTLKPLEKLDFVFSIIKTNTDNGGILFRDLVKHIEDIGYPCGSTMVWEIIEKMKNNKLIIEDEFGYKTSFEGRIFKGYVSQDFLEVQKANIETNRARSLIYATWVAGIGGSIFALIEVVKKLYPYLSIEKWSALIVLFFGILLGFMLKMVILTVGEKQKK